MGKFKTNKRIYKITSVISDDQVEKNLSDIDEFTLNQIYELSKLITRFELDQQNELVVMTSEQFEKFVYYNHITDILHLYRSRSTRCCWRFL